MGSGATRHYVGAFPWAAARCGDRARPLTRPATWQRDVASRSGETKWWEHPSAAGMACRGAKGMRESGGTTGRRGGNALPEGSGKSWRGAASDIRECSNIREGRGDRGAAKRQPGNLRNGGGRDTPMRNQGCSRINRGGGVTLRRCLRNEAGWQQIESKLHPRPRLVEQAVSKPWTPNRMRKGTHTRSPQSGMVRIDSPSSAAHVFPISP